MSESMGAAPIRTIAIFERKMGLTPKDLNKVGKTTIDDLILEKIRAEIEGKCSQHGWVIPGTTRILSRSMCQNESGRFTGTMVSWVQLESGVYFPTDRMEVVGEVLKKNKMGMFVTYENAIQIMIPRDLHLGDSFEDYEAVKIGDYVRVEIKKSRFQINDPYILSVGEFKEIVPAPAATATGPAIKEVVPADAAGPVAGAASDAESKAVETDDEVAGAAAEEDDAGVGAAAAAYAEEEYEPGGEYKMMEADMPKQQRPATATGATIGSFL